MRIDKFTQRAQEAIAAAQELLSQFQHQEMDTEHLLYALLTQENGVVPEIIRKLDANPEELAAAVWKQADTLVVRRAPPVWTPTGKLMPLRASRR